MAQPSSASAQTPRETAIRLTREGFHLYETERGSASWLRQRELFLRATEADPGFGKAWSQLVFTYINMIVAGQSLNPAQDMRMAELGAERALAVSPEHSNIITQPFVPYVGCSIASMKHSWLAVKLWKSTLALTQRAQHGVDLGAARPHHRGRGADPGQHCRGPGRTLASTGVALLSGRGIAFNGPRRHGSGGFPTRALL